MRIAATFIGEDGSLGYQHRQRYILDVRDHAIVRIDGTGFCPYTGIEAFLSNWTAVERLSDDRVTGQRRPAVKDSSGAQS